MVSRWALIAAVILLASFSIFAQNQEPALPDTRKAHDWKGAKGLSPKELEHLAKNKVLLGGETFKQIFSPYVDSDLPVFITSDAVLNAYHVLYEESILRMEKANARRLLEILTHLWTGLDGAAARYRFKPELAAAAKRRAQLVIGTALRLLGDQKIKPDEKTAALIQKEVERIQAAHGSHKPDWLGSPDAGFLALDYSRYQPRGFYEASEALQRYFRAVSWLQSIPFRDSKDEEFLAILLLGDALSDDRRTLHWQKREEYLQCIRCFQEFIGRRDDMDVFDASSDSEENLIGMGLPSARAALLKRMRKDTNKPLIKDQIALSADRGTVVRVISAYRTPDALLFQRTTDPKFQRELPSGMEVAIALGSDFARGQLAGPHKQEVLAAIDKNKNYFSGSTLYHEYLQSLAALLDKPEPDAPAFFGSEAWQSKNCQTALAGWAQLRHTWSLHAKKNVTYLNGADHPPGFVEPEPEFFGRLARLSRRTRAALAKTGALSLDIDFPDAVAELRGAAMRIEKSLPKSGTAEGRRQLADEEQELADRFGDDFLISLDQEISVRQRDDSAKYFAEMIENIRKSADNLERRQLAAPSPVLRAITSQLGLRLPDWDTFETTCRELESLAHKQLRRVPFSKEENDFILNFGSRLAYIMFYHGNSYLTPEDNAPRAVDVFHDPVVGKHFIAAVGRPRALYVLYPAKGNEVLCRGAVMPYYEFSSSKRLKDDKWKSLLDSPQRPASPSWLKALSPNP